jgi:hypothetical protein
MIFPIVEFAAIIGLGIFKIISPEVMWDYSGHYSAISLEKVEPADSLQISARPCQTRTML